MGASVATFSIPAIILGDYMAVCERTPPQNWAEVMDLAEHAFRSETGFPAMVADTARCDSMSEANERRLVSIMEKSCFIKKLRIAYAREIFLGAQYFDSINTAFPEASLDPAASLKGAAIASWLLNEMRNTVETLLDSDDAFALAAGETPRGLSSICKRIQSAAPETNALVLSQFYLSTAPALPRTQRAKCHALIALALGESFVSLDQHATVFAIPDSFRPH